MASQAAHARAYRDRRRGGPPREPAPCGTRAAVRRHERNPDKWGPLAGCPACLTAKAELNAANYQRRKASG